MNMRWIKASERLPGVVETPYVVACSISWDKGSNRVFFKYKGEEFVGRYVQEKMAFKNIFVSAEMDRVINESDFEFIEWLDESESSSPSPLKDVIEEMEKDLYDATNSIEEWKFDNNYLTSQYKTKQLVIEKYLPKLKQTREGSDEEIASWKESKESWEHIANEREAEITKLRIFIKNNSQHENICPSCKDLDRPNYNCEKCNGIGFLDGEGSESYWKKRYEELFSVLKVVFYSTCKKEENPIAEWDKFLERNNYKELRQQLKSSIGEETEGQDELKKNKL